MERVWVSPPPHIVTTAQGACTFEKKRMIRRSLPPPKILGQKNHQATTKVTLTSHQKYDLRYGLEFDGSKEGPPVRGARLLINFNPF